MTIVQYGSTVRLNDTVVLAATAQGYVAAGQTTGSVYTLNGVAFAQLAQTAFQPTQIVVLSDGAYLLDRQQYPNQTQGGAHYEVLNPDGSVRVADSDVASGTGHALGGPAATATANGRFYIGYTDYNTPGTTHVTYPPTSGPVYTGYDPAIAPDSGYIYFTPAGSPPGTYSAGPFSIENTGSFSDNGASGSDLAGAQYFASAATLSGGTVVAAYLNEEINGQAGGGAASAQTVDVRLVTSAGPGAAIRVNQDAPYTNGYTNAYYYDTTHAVRGDGGIQVTSLGTGFAVTWLSRTYVATGNGGDAFTGYNTNVRYYDASGNPLTDTVTLLHRGANDSGGLLSSSVASIGGGRLAILYLDAPGGGSTDQLDLTIIGPNGQSVSTTVIAQGATTNDISYWALASRGDGTIAITYQGPSGNVLSTYAIDRAPPSSAPHDYNADGLSDILFRNSNTGDLGYLATSASGRGAYTGLGGSNVAYSVVGEADFTGEGRADILFRNSATGDFGFLDPSNSSYRTLGGSNSSYSVAGLGDFTGSGHSDVAFRNNATGDFGFLDPSNSSYHTLGASNTAYAIVGTGDFTGAGHTDLLFRNNNTGDLGYTDPTTGGYHPLGGSSTAYNVVGTGDFTGAGHADVLFRNNVTGDMGWLDPTTSSYHSLGGSNAAYAVAGVGLYNPDSTSDILFRNASTGDIGYLAVTSTGTAGPYVSLGGSNTSYSVV